jgi:hypothetical protein
VTVKSDEKESGMSTAQKWDTEEAARLAREAYKYVARTFPPDASLEPLGRADVAVLDAQEATDWQAYEEALRELCRVAKREAMRRRAGAA